MSLRGKLEIVNLTHEGMKRPHNEDSSVTDARLGFAVIADGMGGYKAGEVASAIAVTTILQVVQEGLKSLPAGRVEEGGYSPQSQLLRKAISEANHLIFSTANNEEQCQGMGTTVVAMLFYDNRYSVAHVGDSRLYRLRDGNLEIITTDHSLIQELIDRGFYTPEEAAENTPKNLVTRALGIDEQVEVDVQEDAAMPGDIYLLCSDGLNDMVNDEEIHLTLSKYSANLVEAGNELVNKANAHGGKDNISVILIRPTQAFPARAGWYTKLFGWLNNRSSDRTELWQN